MMHNSLRKAVLASLCLTTALAQASDITCVDGLYIIIARGTGEKQGPGVLGLVAERLTDRIKNSKANPIVYPATYKDPWHVDSIKEGSIAARKAMTEYAEKCPEGKMALLGYSQGAHVMGNAICGDRQGWLNGTVLDSNPLYQVLLGDQKDHLQFPKGPPVDEDLVVDQLVSIVLFGDPTFAKNTTFTDGTSNGDGLWPRDWSNCSIYSPAIKSYCDEGDIICDSSSEYVHGKHQQYLEGYGKEAVEFVIQRWNEETGDDVEVDGGKPFPDLGLAGDPKAGKATQ